MHTFQCRGHNCNRLVSSDYLFLGWELLYFLRHTPQTQGMSGWAPPSESSCSSPWCGPGSPRRSPTPWTPEYSVWRFCPGMRTLAARRGLWPQWMTFPHSWQTALSPHHKGDRISLCNDIEQILSSSSPCQSCLGLFSDFHHNSDVISNWKFQTWLICGLECGGVMWCCSSGGGARPRCWSSPWVQMMIII